MKTPFFAASALALATLTFGCTTPTSSGKTAAAAAHEIDYGHQTQWEFEAGDTQSPIDIVTAQAQPMVDSGALTLHFSSTAIDEVDNGHSIQVDSAGTAVVNGRNFKLAQFHFHAPSEHTLDGAHFPIEVHFVNKAQDGRLAVVGVFFKQGAANPGFQQVLDNVKKGAKNTTVGPINVGTMLPANHSYYHYLGSLTTPPLSENVEWYVMKYPIEVSEAQIATFLSLYNGNNRGLQPLKDRSILLHAE